MPELKIARVETFLFDPGTAKNLLFCRVETEDGLHGWGEAYVTAGKEPVIQQCLQAMAKHVIGRSALNIRHTGQILFDDFAIRRASLDLIGLPPTPEEVQAFLADSSPAAFATVVDRLLASPHYGERWGRHWLDLARYADSNGFEHDFDRPNAWRYRDYVIRAFSEDKPYDVFLKEQLAGDEIDHVTRDSLIATGFLRNSMINDGRMN